MNVRTTHPGMFQQLVSAVDLKLRFLSPEQVKQIDESLISIGEYGEVRLIVQHGELRYVNKVESLKACKK